MNGRKEILVIVGFALSISLLASACTAFLVSRRDSRRSCELLNAVCGEVLEQAPETERMISAALKESISGNEESMENSDALSELGYRRQDFAARFYRQNAFCTLVGFLAGSALLAATLLYRNRKEAGRIRALAGYLEQVNLGKAVILSASGEGDFARLEDEIYKTMTCLYQTRDMAG